MTKYILSVDGGGIRGIIPAVILAEIEKRTGKPIAEIFHFMAGTSTGGIIVAGLSKKNDQGKPKYSAEDLVNLYISHGADIFKSSFIRRHILSWYPLSKYSHANLESVLTNYFGDDPLENTLNKVMLTSYDLIGNNPVFFKSWLSDDNSVRMRDALRATTAAPTVFDPMSLTMNGNEMLLIDGGVFANNPAVCAYANSKLLFPGEEDVVLLSIGTGEPGKQKMRSCFGKIPWIMPLLLAMFDSGGDAIDYQLDKLMNSKYIRIQSPLEKATEDIDDASDENIKFLQQDACNTIQQNLERIETFCRLICKK